MFVGGRILLLLIVIWSWSLLINIKGDFVNTKERRKRHLFPLLGYLHGFKVGQDFALQLPPFVLSPVIIVPSVNQQQNVNVPNVGPDESFHENGDTFQTIMPAKLILNSSVENIETNFRSSPENYTVQVEKVISLNDTLKQVNEATNSSTENNIEVLVSTTENFETTETEELTSFKYNTPTTINSVYPTSSYNNEMINSLQLTAPPTETNLGLPILEENWQNFKPNGSNSDNKVDVPQRDESELGKSVLVRIGADHLTTEQYNYPRPNTRYYSPHSDWYGAIADQFSITTNSYREQEKESPLLPRQDDRWQRFSSLSKVVLPTSGFKPLAGLYFDGFLHKSLTKRTGFIPFDKHDY